MSDTTLLYIGAVCFALLLLGLVLTMREFSKMTASRVESAKPDEVAASARAVAIVAKSRVR